MKVTQLVLTFLILTLSASAPSASTRNKHTKAPVDSIFYAPPYLQNPSSTGVTVMFQTNVVAHCWIMYGTDTLHLQRTQTLYGGQAVCYNLQNSIRLDNLKPGTTYYYKVYANEILKNQSYYKAFGDTATTPFYRFRTPAEGTEDFTALVFNDLHLQQKVLDSLLVLTKDIHYDFTFFNGDCLPEPANFRDAEKNINKLACSVGASEHPVFFIRGNHEIRNAYSPAMGRLLDYPGGNTYGAFSWGDTRFVVLDCGEDKPDTTWVYYGLNDFTAFRQEQVGFLKTELQSNAFRQARKHILFSHIPLYGSTDHYQPCPPLWCPLLAKAPFDVYLAAHIHQFKFFPPHSDVGNPFTEIIGGGPHLKGGGAATVTVLTKRGSKLSAKVISVTDGVIKEIEL